LRVARRTVRIIAAVLVSCLIAEAGMAQRGHGSLGCIAGIVRATLRIAEACHLAVPTEVAERMHRVQAAYLAAEERLNGAQVRAEMDRALDASTRAPATERGCATTLPYAQSFIDGFSGDDGRRLVETLEAEALVTTDPRAGACL
jgi:hypothetical protein